MSKISRRALPLAAVVAVLAGILALSGVLGRGAGRSGATDPRAEGRGGPEVLLRGVEFREVRHDGRQYGLVSDEASYLPADRRLTATGVTLTLQDRSGEIVVRAPRALWDLAAERILLPEGAEAESASGWTAAARTARVSLADRLLTAEGKASLAGPGVAVAGENLVWRWRDGTMELDFPKTRLEPARALRRKG